MNLGTQNSQDVLSFHRFFFEGSGDTMASIAKVVGVAAGAFAATNLDDLLILSVFFAEARASKGAFHPRSILLGQALGFSVICIVR
jgi:hypothetical protein